MEKPNFKFPVLPALGGYNYLDEMKLFYAYFGTIPSMKTVKNLRLNDLSAWIESDLGFKQKHFSWVKRLYIGWSEVGNAEIIYYILNDDMVIKLEEGNMSILFEGCNEAKADLIVEKMTPFKVEKAGNEIHMVIASSDGLETKKVNFKKPNVVLERHYNDDLIPLHNKVVAALNEENRSGLILFHGVPGTGKSTYIRSLICGLQKNVIFMTPELAGSLGSPEISKFLIKNAESIFVIEDAEQLLVSRDSGKNSSISTLLNLTDGILGESLGIQIIATFNSNLHNIDRALLRKGRMLALYEFKPLDIHKSASLLSELGVDDVDVKSPMTLADIYNFNEQEYQVLSQRTSIGFKN
jgi:hypothetical protein